MDTITQNIPEVVRNCTITAVTTTAPRTVTINSDPANQAIIAGFAGAGIIKQGDGSSNAYPIANLAMHVINGTQFTYNW